MGMNQTFLTGMIVMFLSGIGIPVMAAINAHLGRGLESPPAATTVLFGLGFVLASLVMLRSGVPTMAQFSSVPAAYYSGAVFVLFYVLAVTYFAPRIGVGNAVFFVLIGQLIAAAAIDHFGLLGAIRTPLTAQRALGIAVMAAGVWLAKKPV